MLTGVVLSSAAAMLLLALLTMRTMNVGVLSCNGDDDVVTALAVVDDFERGARAIYPRMFEAAWAFTVNITPETRQALDAEVYAKDLWARKMGQRALSINTTGLPPDLKRKITAIGNIDSATLDDITLKRKNKVSSQMESIPFDQRTGPAMKAAYVEYVNISNIIASNRGFSDYGAYSRRVYYESDTLEDDVAELYEEILPFYRELHAFIRRRARLFAGSKNLPASGHMPEYFLNFAHYHWLMKPYPSKSVPDVTSEMKRQNYTVERMFRLADDFFISLGLTPMPQEFWDESMFENPLDGRQVICHPVARDFFNGRDFRISACMTVNSVDFVTAHDEMGHVQYFLQYKHLPIVYRRGANPAFHEAVGDLISLSVNTPEHLHKVGLLPTLENDPEVEMNFLFQQAMKSQVLDLPDVYRTELWRWKVFRGEILPDQYNQAWSTLGCRLRGLFVTEDSGEDGFNPGSSYQLTIGLSVIRYFLANVIKFQFHKALCEEIGHVGPLHKCDIYNSTAAGDKLHSMLSLGQSQVWTVPFQAMTGTTRISPQPMLEYFQPLIDFLRQENGEDKGWDPDCAPVPSP